MPRIDKRSPYGIASRHFQPTGLLRDFVHHLQSDLGTAFHFDNVGRPFRLDEQVDLQAGTFLAFLPIGGGGIDERVFKVEERKQLLEMVDDKVLKLQSQHGLPALELVKARKCESIFVDKGRGGLDVLEVKP